MTAPHLSLPITNSGSQPIEVELEPEGMCLPVPPGKRAEVRFIRPFKEPLDLEVEVEGDLILIHASASKELWIDGRLEYRSEC